MQNTCKKMQTTKTNDETRNKTNANVCKQKQQKKLCKKKQN